VLALSLSATTAAAAPRRYTVDAAASQVVIHVGKAGLFRFAGHGHEVVAPIHQGSAVVDPDHLESASVELAFPAAALRVTGRGEPAGDVPKVQQAMVGPECLDAGRFPNIRFTSRAVTVKARTGDGVDVLVRGELTLHGVSREVLVPVHVVLGKDSISATGTTRIRQTAFGIKPISVAGVVNVKDELEITWRVVGRAVAAQGTP
jgi:polyisoprenoid-binding protein YceI